MKKTDILKILIFLTVAFIWIQSLMPPDISKEESGFVVKVLETFLGSGNVSEHLIRKLAHFTEYALLGLELMAYFNVFHLSAFHGVFIAALDETIQIISSRGSSLVDVWIDFSGCLTGILIINLIRRSKSKKE